MCRVLGVSRSGEYACLSRPPSDRLVEDAWLTDRIHEIHEEIRGTYGLPRIQAELQDEGWSSGQNRVARLMGEAGLQGVSRRNGTVTTTRGSGWRPAPDLVERSCPDSVDQ